MKSPPYLAAALAVSLALLSQGSAMAAGTATAAISNVQFGVLDLTPGDDVAAGYSMDKFSTTLSANFKSWTETEYRTIRPDPHVPASLGYERGPSHAWASSAGVAGELGSNAAAHPNLDVDTRLMASSLQIIDLTLRPNSVLTVSGHFSFLAERSEGGSLDFAASGGTSANLKADIGNVSSAGRAFWVYPGSLVSDGWEQDFMLTYGNNSDRDIKLSLSFSTDAQVITRQALPAVSPVPEPATWSMLGAGLALVGFAASRRRPRNRQRPA